MGSSSKSAADTKTAPSAEAAPGSRVVLDPAGIQRATTRIAHEILERNTEPEDLALVAILSGGLVVGQRINAALEEIAKREIPLGALDVTLYRDDVVGHGRRPMPKPTRMPFSVTGKRVILVDDVMFTGRTVRSAMDAVIDFGRPEAIQVATLVDRGHRELPIRVDFVGKNIPTSRGEQVVLRETDAGELEVVVE
ncbi:MAG: bifunctional pyr operon transcriptional regulator/uracil phosphoribosyltransferase PyrR [bacterium]|nr:bifunctional pyr operon transcriptional regulator/uracil phosphoribosyltransferase PyrR [bacterium]